VQVVVTSALPGTDAEKRSLVPSSCVNIVSPIGYQYTGTSRCLMR
jgi:hypothetical protein